MVWQAIVGKMIMSKVASKASEKKGGDKGGEKSEAKKDTPKPPKLKLDAGVHTGGNRNPIAKPTTAQSKPGYTHEGY